METNDLIGLNLLLAGTVLSIVLLCAWQWARDAALFAITFGMMFVEKMEKNFFGNFWYRGTTRGVEVSVLDVLALGLLISSVFFPPRNQNRPRWFWPASLGLMLVYLVYAGASAMLSEPTSYGYYEWSKMVRGVLYFMAAAAFIRSEREIAILVLGLCCAVCYEGVLTIKERVLEGVDRVTGSLDHANSLSMYLCLVAPLFPAAFNSGLPRWLRWFCIPAIAAAAVASVLTLSRAGVPIFGLVMLGATVMCISWRITVKKVVVTMLIVAAVGGLFVKIWPNLKARYAEASMEEEYLDKQVEGRGYYLRLAKAIVSDRFFGVGLNNWSYWVSKKYGVKVGRPYEDYDRHKNPAEEERVWDYDYAAPAHNLAALTVGELGLPGLVLFVLLWIRWFQMGSVFLWKRSTGTMYRIGTGIFFCICGIFLQSLTEWVYRQTQIFLTFNLLLGTLASLYYVKRHACRKPAHARAELPVVTCDLPAGTVATPAALPAR